MTAIKNNRSLRKAMAVALSLCLVLGMVMIMPSYAQTDIQWVEGSTLEAFDISASTVTLKWNAVENATAYKVLQDDAVIAEGITGTSWTATGLTKDTTYTFKVEAGALETINAETVSPAAEITDLAFEITDPSAETTDPEAETTDPAVETLNPAEETSGAAEEMVYTTDGPSLEVTTGLYEFSGEQGNMGSNYFTVKLDSPKAYAISNDENGYYNVLVDDLDPSASILRFIFSGTMNYDKFMSNVGNITIYHGDTLLNGTERLRDSSTKICDQYLIYSLINPNAQNNSDTIEIALQPGMFIPGEQYTLVLGSEIGQNRVGTSLSKNVAFNFTIKERDLDTEVPVWPVGSNIYVKAIDDTSATLKWSPAQDNAGVAAYKILVNDKFAGITANNENFTIKGLIQDTVYIVKITALDNYANESLTLEKEIKTDKADSQPPVWAAGAKLNIDKITSSTADLSWNNAIDNRAVTEYQIYCGEQEILTGIVSNHCTIENLEPDTEYTFSVYAYDAAGNRSAALIADSVKTSLGPKAIFLSPVITENLKEPWGVNPSTEIIVAFDEPMDADTLTIDNISVINGSDESKVNIEELLVLDNATAIEIKTEKLQYGTDYKLIFNENCKNVKGTSILTERRELVFHTLSYGINKGSFSIELPDGTPVTTVSPGTSYKARFSIDKLSVKAVNNPNIYFVIRNGKGSRLDHGGDAIFVKSENITFDQISKEILIDNIQLGNLEASRDMITKNIYIDVYVRTPDEIYPLAEALNLEMAIVE